jgi:hypothetical protein
MRPQNECRLVSKIVNQVGFKVFLHRLAAPVAVIRITGGWEKEVHETLSRLVFAVVVQACKSIWFKAIITLQLLYSADIYQSNYTS